MAHGEWLPWLDANVDVLGFGRSTAKKLMKAAKGQSTALLNAPEALSLSRRMWGNKEILEDAKLSARKGLLGHHTTRQAGQTGVGGFQGVWVPKLSHHAAANNLSPI